MVSRIRGGLSRVGWNLNSRRLISGFGVRRRRTVTRGRGVVRRAVGAIARPALGFIANKIADMISGGRIVRHQRSGGSYRLTGMGRRPRTTLSRRRPVRRAVGCGYKRRAPRRTLGGRRRVYRRRV